MRERKSLAAALILVFAVLFAVPVLAEEPAAPEAPGLIDFAALTAQATQDAPAESEEPALLPEDPSKPIFVWEDSGICCTSSASCPNVSGYAKKCDIASCGRSCLYRRL